MRDVSNLVPRYDATDALRPENYTIAMLARALGVTRRTIERSILLKRITPDRTAANGRMLFSKEHAERIVRLASEARRRGSRYVMKCIMSQGVANQPARPSPSLLAQRVMWKRNNLPRARVNRTRLPQAVQTVSH